MSLRIAYLLALLAPLQSGCANLKAAGPGLIDCATPLMTTLTADVLGQVGGALKHDTFAGGVLLNDMLAQLGPAVVCGVVKIASEGGAQPQAAGSGPDPTRQEMAANAAAWLKAGGHRTRGAP